MDVAVHAPPPAAGSCDVSTVPMVSVATHSSSAVHETALSGALGSIVVAVQCGEAAARSIEVTTWPSASTATQSVVETQETPVSAVVPSTLSGTAHVPVSGEVDEMTFPAPSTAP